MNDFRYLCLSLGTFFLYGILVAQPPATYVSGHTSRPPVIDGHTGDPCWEKARWTSSFTDIEGSVKPGPKWDTRVKMCWDRDHLYLLAVLEEPHLWATLEKRDAVVYHDNDFEVFLDPDGDHHHYFELEINALGTEWDLFLNRPYKDGGKAFTGWDIRGLRTAVSLQGSLNQPEDRDTGWIVEIAIPFASLKPYSLKWVKPQAGNVWRVNFSRVQWPLEIDGGGYRKKTDPVTGKNLRENNWVWSPQGVVNMHRPETWGYLVFAETGEELFPNPDPYYEEKQLLIELYYAQRDYYRSHQRYISTDSLNLPRADSGQQVQAEFTRKQFLLFLETENGTLYMDHQSRLWFEPDKKDTP